MATIEQLEDRIAEWQQQKDAINLLRKQHGWKIVEDTILAAIRVRRIKVTETLIGSLDAAFAVSGAQGELGGLQYAHRIASMLVEEAEENIAQLRDEIAQMKGNDNG